MRTERYELLIRSTVEQVWDHLTTPDGLSSWFGTRAEVEPRVDGDRVIGWGDDPSEIVGKIVEIEPGRRLRVAYLVEGAEIGAEEWLVATEGDMVRLTLIHSLADEGVDDWEGFYGDIRRGWNLFLASLQFGLEEAVHPNRRAVCRFLPVAADRKTVWEEVIEGVSHSSVVDGMDRRLSDPPNSLLLVAPDRTLLLDLEGADPGMVLYAQASTHGNSKDEWAENALQVVATAVTAGTGV